MSDETDAADQQERPKPLPSLTLAETIQFIKDNFVLVSALAVLIGVAFATTVLAAYLSVFDWHLIWFVQYPDIITFGLIALGVVPGSALFLLPVAQGMLVERKADGSFGRNGLIWIVSVIAVLIALTIWGAVRKGDSYSHIFSAVTALGSAIGLLSIIASLIKNWKVPDAVRNRPGHLRRAGMDGDRPRGSRRPARRAGGRVFRRNPKESP